MPSPGGRSPTEVHAPSGAEKTKEGWKPRSPKRIQPLETQKRNDGRTRTCSVSTSLAWLSSRGRVRWTSLLASRPAPATWKDAGEGRGCFWIRMMVVLARAEERFWKVIFLFLARLGCATRCKKYPKFKRKLQWVKSHDL